MALPRTSHPAVHQTLDPWEPTNRMYVTPSTPHIYINKGIKIQILIKSIFKTFLNIPLLCLYIYLIPRIANKLGIFEYNLRK